MRDITDDMIHAALATVNQKQLEALIEIVERAGSYRGRIVRRWDVDMRRANALVVRGLVTSHTVPHRGHKATDLGIAVVRKIRPRQAER